jgi:hypothetical protein
MFRFTIRDVLWLTVVVALGVGWYCDNRAQAANVSRWQWRAIQLNTELLYDGIDASWSGECITVSNPKTGEHFRRTRGSGGVELAPATDNCP